MYICNKSRKKTELTELNKFIKFQDESTRNLVRVRVVTLFETSIFQNKFTLQETFMVVQRCRYVNKYIIFLL